jgi:hypothetical protein
LDLTEAIISDSGFSIQLNANSKEGAGRVDWQQYGFQISGNKIAGFISTWQNAFMAIVCDGVDLCSTPFNNGIPAGYALAVRLLNDSDGNITGAAYQVFDENNNQLANKTLLVQNARCNCPGGPCAGFMPGDLTPITTLSAVIVGLGNSTGTNLTSGAGSITYSVAPGQLLTATADESVCVKELNTTAETSNSSYGTLSVCSTQSITQSFSVAPQSPPTCTKTTGACTGINGARQCMTINKTTQCCDSNLAWGNYPWIVSCSDRTVSDKGCTGPCY